jgi:phosphatidylglycerophosphate synthase
MYFLTALGLFLYQSLDAIDGKQARRTNSSSPLGELFDHGCDSVSAGNFLFLKNFDFCFYFDFLVFVTVACCCAVQLGLYPWLMFWCCMMAYTAFYCAHWQTYVSGKLRFGK